MKISAVAIVITLLAIPARGQVQERTIRWGHLNNTDHPVSLGVQKFGEILATKSGGKLKVREFAASQLGNEMQMQSALRGGTQEMLSASTTSLASAVKEFGKPNSFTSLSVRPPKRKLSSRDLSGKP